MASRSSTCRDFRASSWRMTMTLQNTSSARKLNVNLCWRRKCMANRLRDRQALCNCEGGVGTRNFIAQGSRTSLSCGPVGGQHDCPAMNQDRDQLSDSAHGIQKSTGKARNTLAELLPDADYEFPMRFQRGQAAEFFGPQGGSLNLLAERQRW